MPCLRCVYSHKIEHSSSSSYFLLAHCKCVHPTTSTYVRCSFMFNNVDGLLLRIMHLFDLSFFFKCREEKCFVFCGDKKHGQKTIREQDLMFNSLWFHGELQSKLISYVIVLNMMKTVNGSSVFFCFFSFIL